MTVTNAGPLNQCVEEALLQNRAHGGQALSDAQLGDHIGYETLLGLRIRAKTRRELHRQSKEIQVIFYWLTRRGPDSNLKGNLFLVVLVLSQRELDSGGAASRCHCGHEGRHDAIAGVLDLAAAGFAQGVANDSVVDFEERHGAVVAKALRKPCRIDDVSEKNRANSRIALVLRAALKDGCARWVHFGSSKESFGNLGRDFDDLRCDEPVRLPVDRGGRLRAWCTAETENLSGGLVEPVLVVLDAILRLRLDIVDVRLGNICRSCAANLVDVHICRHVGL